MSVVALYAAASLAGEMFTEEVPAPAFFLDAPGFRLNIETWPAPAWTAVAGERVCAMTVIAGDSGIGVETFECPTTLRDAALQALAGWRWNPTSRVPPGTALLRISFLFPAEDDPRSAVFAWPLVAGGQLTSVPPDIVEMRADRLCSALPRGGIGVMLASDAGIRRVNNSVTCTATVHIDWFGKSSLTGIGACPDRVRDLVEAEILRHYQDLCPVGRLGVPITSESTREVTLNEGMYRPDE